MKTKLFYTRLLDKNVAGCDNVYQFIPLASKHHIGQINGNTGEIYFLGNPNLFPEQLRDLVKLVAKILNHVNK